MYDVVFCTAYDTVLSTVTVLSHLLFFLIFLKCSVEESQSTILYYGRDERVELTPPYVTVVKNTL